MVANSYWACANFQSKAIPTITFTIGALMAIAVVQMPHKKTKSARTKAQRILFHAD